MKSLAVKYRPKNFNDVCSQESIVTILQRQLELNQLKNAYLFAGASGCGKTTVARIFALEINKYQNSDGVWQSSEPIEIDGASNNGVDNVKTIISNASERSLDGKYKIYIIDECHALTSQAWQAFLKCIEEPPEFTIFIFCTTDPQKIPVTILNRVMRFNFTRISETKIKDRLLYICEQEQFINYTDSCEYLSRLAHGCMRDAISLLDKAASFSTDLTINNVLNAVGNFSYTTLFDTINSFIDGNEKNILAIIENLYSSGQDLSLFVDQLLSFMLDIDKYIIFNTISMTSIPNIFEANIKNAINFANPAQHYTYLINKMLDCKNMIKNDTDAKSTITVCFLNICRCL